jgi:hypothetical protein
MDDVRVNYPFIVVHYNMGKDPFCLCVEDSSGASTASSLMERISDGETKSPPKSLPNHNQNSIVTRIIDLDIFDEFFKTKLF